ncbi:MAG: hypothetical protein LBO69_06610 [Ignavibacteria bacterium]|jgi:hypothetical protein|nr:hypothetical protein [Ignavibacteria bacterium]
MKTYNDYKDLLLQINSYLNESVDFSLNFKRKLTDDLLKLSYVLDEFYNNILTDKNGNIHNRNTESFYVHIHKPGKHLAKIRISEYAPLSFNKIVNDIVKNKYQYYYIINLTGTEWNSVFSKFFLRQCVLQADVSNLTQVDYVSKSIISNDVNKLVINIMDTILTYLQTNNIIISGLEIDWNISKI